MFKTARLTPICFAKAVDEMLLLILSADSSASFSMPACSAGGKFERWLNFLPGGHDCSVLSSEVIQNGKR